MVGDKPTVALVSREVAPFGGGGIGRYVSALAALLADEFEVTIFTTSRHRAAHDAARRDQPASLPPAKLVFVREPRPWDARASFSRLHAWSSRVHEALLGEYGGRGPDLVEFGDFLGEGCVTVQAKRTGSPALRQTMVCVRIHGSAEVYDVLDGFLPGDRERSFTHELERYSLRYADSLLWAGGDILGSYERFYGATGSRRRGWCATRSNGAPRLSRRRRRRARCGCSISAGSNAERGCASWSTRCSG